MQHSYSENVEREEETLLEVRKLKKWFPVRRGIMETLRRNSLYVKAVDGIDFSIGKREVLGLVGESGCGKTTLARLLVGLIEPTDGEVTFKGRSLSSISNRPQRIQMVFQDPYEHLSPWSNVERCLLEPLRINRIFKDKKEERDRIKEIMEMTGLSPIDEFLPKHPFELSGGQRQRVMIARAFVLNPELVIADEPVSMLDASISIGILNLILDLVEKYLTSFLYITHDLAVASYVCNQIGVMYLGKIVEMGSVDEVITRPRHPYSKALICAVPDPDPTRRTLAIPIKGQIQTARDLPAGCRFHPRCPFARDFCRKKEPELVEAKMNHFVRCHYAA